MRSLSRLLIVAMLLASVALVAVPAFAQEDGGIISVATFGASPGTLNPIYCTDTACQGIIRFINVGIFGVDPVNAVIAPNQPGAIVRDWEVSEDNLTYTLSLRDDLTWTDGEVLNADDLLYQWENITTNPEANYSLAYYAEEIESVTQIDEFTVEVVMKSPSCDALGTISGALGGRGRVVPSHVFSQYEVSELADIDYSTNPDVTAGAFVFGEFRPSELTTVLSRGEYVDAETGVVLPAGIIQSVLPDQTVLIEEFLSPNGQVNVIESVPPNRVSDIQAAAEAGTHQIYTYPGNTWDYMAFNMADPTNPQSALDADGNRIDQGYHPIFSDKLVRQAISHAVNVDAIIEGAVFGNGSRMAAQLTTSSWAYHPELEPRSYNAEVALELLAEAGWVPNEEGTLICDNCLYAREVDESFNGSPLEFELITNSGNSRREAIGAIIQDELAQIGITVDFQTIEFNTLLDMMDAQTYDTLILGWQAGYPDAPDTMQLFGAASDVPGSGNNFTSFYNEEYFALEQEALNVPGCADADRAPIYHAMQEIMYDEVPYLWLYSIDGLYAARSSVNGFDPHPANLWWNVTEWTVAAE